MNRHPNIDYKNRNEPQVELESQFVLRLPPVIYMYIRIICIIILFRDIISKFNIFVCE